MLKIQIPREAGVKGFALTLMEMDARIKTYGFVGDLSEGRGYLPDKKTILFPIFVPSAEHEIAHMVEMRNSERWTLPDWGMAPFNEENDFFSKWKSSDGLFSALSREIRVRTIQLYMCPEELRRTSTMFNILNNSHWEDLVKKALPFKSFKTMKDVERWVEALRDKTFDAWSLDRIHYEWSVRLEHIQHWMES